MPGEHVGGPGAPAYEPSGAGRGHAVTRSRAASELGVVNGYHRRSLTAGRCAASCRPVRACAAARGAFLLSPVHG